MKYIVMRVVMKGSKEGEHFVLEVPFVFPEIIVHSMMCGVCVRLCMDTWSKAMSVLPISAGFVSSTAFEDECYGESESLKLKSRPEDSDLIRMCDYGSMYA
jgi:hypothetical protein